MVARDDAFQAMEARLAGLLPRLNERDRRLALATEARSWGYGGITAVHRATGASRSTIRRSLAELDSDTEGRTDRVRGLGGGRKKAEVADLELLGRLDALIEPGTRGDPESPLQWTTKSTRHLANELTAMGHTVSHSVVAQILRSVRFSLQGTRKTLEGTQQALLRWRNVSMAGRCGAVSDGVGEFGEGRREPMPWTDVHAEFVVTAEQILDEGVPGTDHTGRAEPLQTAHRPQPGLEPTMIGFDRVTGVLLHDVASAGQQLIEHTRVGRRPVRGPGVNRCTHR